MEDGGGKDAEGWLSILIASSAPSIAQWADIVQNLSCHANAKVKDVRYLMIFRDSKEAAERTLNAEFPSS